MVWKNLPPHICNVCGVESSFRYGHKGTWYCLDCWLKAELWKG